MQKIKVSHILCEHKYEIQDVLRRLQQGEAFEKIAAQVSRCSSARQNGYIGEVSEKQVDPDFFEALQILKPGQISPCVRTRFGYHLIRRES